MKKSVLGVALAAVLMSSSVTSAAPVNLVARETSPTTWDVFAQTDVDLGAIALVAKGFDTMTLNLEGGASISFPDSIINPRTGALTVTGKWDFGTPFLLLPAGSPETLLMTLAGSDGPKTIVSGDADFGYTALDERLWVEGILDYSLTLVFLDGTSVTTLGPAPVPEPVTPIPVPKPVTPMPIPRPPPDVVPGGTAPIPEPRSVVVFAAGAIVVAWAIARSRRGREVSRTA